MVWNSMPRRVAGSVCAFLIFCLAVAVTDTAAQSGFTQGPGDPTVGGIQGAVPARPLDTVVAKSTLGEIRIRELHDYYKWFKPPVAPIVPAERVPEMPREWLARLAVQYALAKVMEEKALAVEDPAVQKQFKQQFESLLLNYAIEEMKNRRIESRIVEPPEEEIKAYYEQHKVEYFQPFQFTMRHIFLSTYELYEVKSTEDDLVQIAERISGDAAMVANIRSDSEGRPLRWVPEDERDKQLYKPLHAGERLWVPMGPKKLQEVRERLEKIAQEIKAGASFEEMAKKYSESEGDNKGVVIGPLPTGIKPLVPELLEAATKTPKEGISEVFRTKHGWNLIQVVDKKEEGYLPLDEVRHGPLEFGEPGIVEVLKQEQREKLELELNDEMYALPQLKIHWDVLEKAPNIGPNSVITSVGTHEIIWSDLEKPWLRRFGPEGKPERESIEYLLRRFPPIQLALTLAWCEEHKIFQEPDLSRAYAAVHTGSYSKSWFDREIQKAGEEGSTEELAREFYKNNRERFKLPERMSYQVIEIRPKGEDYAKGSDRDKKRILDAMMKDLRKDLNGFRTIDDFLDYAYRYNPPMDDPAVQFTSPLIAKQIDISYLSGPTGAAAKSLKAGRWSEPYIEGETVRAVAVTERIPEGERTFPESKDEIVLELRTEARNRASREISEKLIKEIEFEIVLQQ